MAIFDILEPPDGKPEGVVFIPEGFSWAALVFTMFWAMFHRMWMVAAVLFAVYAGVAVAEASNLIGPVLGSAIHIGISLLFGFEARRLKSLSLVRAGFRPVGLVEATSLEVAELTYFAGRGRAVATRPISLRGPAQAPDTLGIFGNV